MNKRTYTYDPELAVITVNRTYLTGFAEDSKIECAKNANTIEAIVGVDGNVHYSKNADKTGTVTMHFMSTSPSLPYLRALAREQEEFTFSLVDMNENGENIASDECVILKETDINIKKNVEGVSIEIFVPFLY